MLKLRSKLSNAEWCCIALITCVLLVSYLLPELRQDETYHAFADTRAVFGISHGMDVISNLAFLVTGLYGVNVVLTSNTVESRAFKISLLTFFTGVLLTSFGSSYYHLNPTSATLIWDRLPMTIAFAGMCGTIACDKVSKRVGALVLLVTLLLGAWSIITWATTSNLTPYATLQFAGLLMVAVACFLRKNPNGATMPWHYILLFYVCAKVAEHFDAYIFELTYHLVSGHTLKHLLAGCAALAVALHIRLKE